MIFLKVSFVALALAMFAGIGVWNIKVTDRDIAAEAENKELKNRLEECHQAAHTYNAFKKTAESIGSEDWSSRFNNCYDHSKKLQKELAMQGIESSIMIGANREHAWVCPWIEANTGNFIPPGKFSVLELRDKNLNVICKK